MRPDFDDFGIRLVATGHDHDYQSFKVEGFTYVVNGVGGAERHQDCGGSNSKSGASKFCQGTEFGAVFLTATDDYMTVEFRSVAKGYPMRDTYTIERLSTNQPTNRPTDQSTNQPINPPPACHSAARDHGTRRT